MENELKKYRAFLYAGIIISASSALFVTIYIRLNYDPGLRLLNVGCHGVPVIVLSCVALLFAALFALSMKRDIFPLTYPRKSSLFTTVSSALCGGMMILTVLLQFVRNGSSDDRLADLWSSPDGGITLTLLKIDLILAMLGCAYFFISTFTDRLYPVAAALTGLWLFFWLIRTYYDMVLPLNDPLRKLSVVSICSALLFLLAEIRIAIKKPSPAFCVFSGCVALFFCGVSGFSKLFLTLTGFLPFEIQSVYGFFEAVFALYALSRMLRLTKYEAFFEITSKPSAPADPSDPSDSADPADPSSAEDLR